jgi:peptidyl-prolyl cis-trans isomerase C
MRRFLPLLIFVPGIALAAPLANVNGQTITEAMVQAANPAAASSPIAKKQTLQVLISRMLLTQQAAKAGWTKAPVVQAALATQRLAVLSEVTALHYWAKHPIPQAQLSAAYQKALATLPSKEYRLREILVRDRAKAEHLLTALQHGASFSQLAARHSSRSYKKAKQTRYLVPLSCLRAGPSCKNWVSVRHPNRV